jgi:hypothetical protein
MFSAKMGGLAMGIQACAGKERPWRIVTQQKFQKSMGRRLAYSGYLMVGEG